MTHARKLLAGLGAFALAVGLVAGGAIISGGVANAGLPPMDLVVNTTDDLEDVSPDLTCGEDHGGDCSLREAVQTLVSNDGGGSITFSVDGTFGLGDDISVGNDVTIIGNGVDKTIITSTDSDRHFRVQRGDLTLRSMTLRDGINETGGSVYVSYLGALLTQDVHFIDNFAAGGGAIFADGENDTVDIRSTTFAGNGANAGGAIYVNVDTVSVVNSTFTANTARSGAAVYSWNAGTVDIHWSTFSGNVVGDPDFPDADTKALQSQSFQGVRSSAWAPRGFGGQEFGVIAGRDDSDETPTITISHSILEKTTGIDTDECSGATFVSGGANIVDDESCGFSEPLDLEGTAANVGALQDNGGATFTMALTAVSAAVDVDPALCKLNDQRDLPRNVDGDADGTDACDSGAFELQATPATTAEPTTSTSAPDDDVAADTATPATPTVAKPTFTG